MKLHQLRYLAAVAQSGLNITAAAQKLHTSQPGVSKQIKLLEDELGFQIFVREGRNLTRITPAGQQVIERALKILQEAQSIRDLSTELRDEGKGSLSIGTTHTQWCVHEIGDNNKPNISTMTIPPRRSGRSALLAPIARQARIASTAVTASAMSTGRLYPASCPTMRLIPPRHD